MPTVYGEGGRRAFRRLQEEILKRTSDQTLFAWGHVLPIHTAMFREKFSFSSYHDDSHLFAPSPTAFRNSGDFVPMPLHLAVKQVMTSLGIKTIPNKVRPLCSLRMAITRTHPNCSGESLLFLRMQKLYIPSRLHCHHPRRPLQVTCHLRYQGHHCVRHRSTRRATPPLSIHEHLQSRQRTSPRPARPPVQTPNTLGRRAAPTLPHRRNRVRGRAVVAPALPPGARVLGVPRARGC